MTSWKLKFLYGEHFFNDQAVWFKVMVKLWGGVFCILIEGVRSTFIHLLIFFDFIDFYRFYWFFYRFYWFFDRFYWFYWFFIDFIDWFLSILLIFHRFYWFFTDFIHFCWFFWLSFAYFQQFLNKFLLSYEFLIKFLSLLLRNNDEEVCSRMKRCVMYNIDQVLLWGSHDLCIQPRGCFYSRNTENF